LIRKEKDSDFTVFLEGLDDAIVGLDFVADPPRVVYSVEKIIDILSERDGMTLEEAVEFYEYNIYNLYAGQGTPIYCDIMTREEIEDVLTEHYGING
jgi:hypothetical protein